MATSSKAIAKRDALSASARNLARQGQLLVGGMTALLDELESLGAVSAAELRMLREHLAKFGK